MTVELGSVREVWLAPVDEHATNKNSFLVRDDAYTIQEASFGRQVRLGQPIDLGPDSSFNQDGWYGGAEQERWNDELMYFEGSADVTDRQGRLKLWPGWRHVFGRKNRPGVIPAHIIPGGYSDTENPPLIVCEGDDQNPSTGDASTWDLFLAGDGFNVTAVHSFDDQIRAVAPLGNEAGDSTGTYIIGDRGGRLWKYSQSGGTVAEDTSSGFAQDYNNPIGHKAICGYNGSTYYGRGRALYRRTFTSGPAVHTVVKSIGTIDEIRSLIVWQNRMWFLGIAAGGHTTLFTSDGVTVAAVIDFPHGFRGRVLLPHYGSLYVGGVVNDDPGGEAPSGQLWRYNGSSLTQLWDAVKVGHEGGGGITSLCSYQRFVVWGRHGNAAAGKRAGVWLYDAEEDAISEGPSMDMDPASSHYQVYEVAEWHGTIVIGVRDERTITASTYDHPYLVAYMRKDDGVRLKLNTADLTGVWSGQSFGYEPSTISRSVTSSEYDAGLPAEDKVWLTGFVRCKVPEGSQVRIGVSVDDGAETIVQAITYNGSAAWRNVRFDVVDANNVNLRGGTLKYTVYVENTDNGNDASTANPEVDFVGFQFRVAAEKRRMFYLRILATDGQERLDGTANPLTTRDAIVTKLMDLWQSNETLSFWEADADPTTSGEGTSIRVTMNNFMDQPYRLASDSTEVMSEVSFTLLEVV